MRLAIKTKVVIGVGIIVCSIGLWRVYEADAMSVKQAIVVREFVLAYCQAHNEYPSAEHLSHRFSQFSADQEWYYWLEADKDAATFQYPMTLPLSNAPGRLRLSEFFPMIYAYTVRDPCQSLLQPILSDQP